MTQKITSDFDHSAYPRDLKAMLILPLKPTGLAALESLFSSS